MSVDGKEYTNKSKVQPAETQDPRVASTGRGSVQAKHCMSWRNKLSSEVRVKVAARP